MIYLDFHVGLHRDFFQCNELIFLNCYIVIYMYTIISIYQRIQTRLCVWGGGSRYGGVNMPHIKVVLTLKKNLIYTHTYQEQGCNSKMDCSFKDDYPLTFALFPSYASTAFCHSSHKLAHTLQHSNSASRFYSHLF